MVQKKILNKVLNFKQKSKNLSLMKLKTNDQLKLTKIKFDNINDYLISRNKSLNSKNMINDKKIGHLDHYNWWFDKEFKLEVLLF